MELRGGLNFISEISVIGLSHTLPEGKAYGASMGLARVRQTGLIRLELEDGTVGWGEAWGPAAVSQAYLDTISAYFIGISVDTFPHAIDLILSRHYHFGIQNQMMSVISGIDVAARDAMARHLGVPICSLLGGAVTDNVPVYASGGYVTEDGEAGFERQMDLIANKGFRAAKIKIGLSPASDEWRVAVARKILGDDVDLFVDANGNYSVDAALESMRRIERYRIGWYEEPLAPQDFDGYSELRRRAPMPIATGEALYTAFDFKRLTDLRGADILQPDLSLCGGLGEGRRIADLARLNHVRLSPHVWGAGIGLATACHFVASLSSYPQANNRPFPTLVEYDVGENPLRDALLDRPIELRDGALRLPTGPGLGVTPEPAALERFAS